MTEKIWTIKDIIKWSSQYLDQAGSETPRLDAELLLAHALQCRRLDLYLDHHKPLIAEERLKYKQLIKRRALGEPVAYILEAKDFYGFTFAVNRSTLIPRPDTELLVELVLNNFPQEPNCIGLDIGTGSGCIGISIKKHRPTFEMWGWDLSSAALEVAAANAAQLEVGMNWQQSDALDPKTWSDKDRNFHFIVSNPPYIAPEERAELSTSVVAFEPKEALFAAERGLAFYKIFAQYAPLKLRKGGKIFLEVGYRQAAEVSSILKSHAWADVTVHNDLSKHERVVVATWV